MATASRRTQLVGGVAADALCRGAFGFGSLLVALSLALLVRRAVQSNSKI